MKHQKKTFGIVWLVVWMIFAALFKGNLWGHIIAFSIGLVVAVAVDRIIREYESDVIRKNRSN